MDYWEQQAMEEAARRGYEGKYDPEEEASVEVETSEQRVMEQKTRDLLEPSVLHLRRELFDDEHPRFDTWADAVEWLEGEADREVEGDAQAERSESAGREVFETLRQLNRLVGPGRKVRIEYAPLLQYVRPDEGAVRYLRARPGSPLGMLAQGSEAIWRASGFQRWKVVRWVLTGEEPPLPLALVQDRHESVELPDGRTVSRHFVAVKVNVQPVRGLTWDQWKQLRPLLQKFWNHPLLYMLNEKEQTLLEVVDRRGGPPETPWSQDFWEGVKEELTERGIEGQRGPYQHFQSVAKAYYKARKKGTDVPGIQIETEEASDE